MNCVGCFAITWLHNKIWTVCMHDTEKSLSAKNRFFFPAQTIFLLYFNTANKCFFSHSTDLSTHAPQQQKSLPHKTNLSFENNARFAEAVTMAIFVPTINYTCLAQISLFSFFGSYFHVLLWLNWLRLVDFFFWLHTVTHRRTRWLFRTICCVCTLYTPRVRKKSFRAKVSIAIKLLKGQFRQPHSSDQLWLAIFTIWSRNRCHVMNCLLR